MRVDKTAAVAFATTCRVAGVRHFQLMSAIGANATSASFYLRTKGELQNAIVVLGFERMSFFQPSMILTPTNRYGWSQALLLALGPKLSSVLQGGLRKYRGVEVETLGAAIARNVARTGRGVELLQWNDFVRFKR